MISLKELIKSVDFNSLDKDTQNNLLILLERINRIRSDFNKSMIVTSGLRSMEDHLRIYKEKGISQDKVPMKSKHLYGQAVDISDPKKELQKWCIDNESKLKQYELWCEDFSATPNWVHFQIVPPKSGNRFFKP